MNRDFTASRPDALWVADFTYCSTWSGIVYVAFFVDVFSRRLVGWKAARSMTTPLVLDALNMAAWTRRHTTLDGLLCHSDAGSQGNTRQFSTPSASTTSGRRRPSAPSPTASITPWPNQSWGCSRPSCTVIPPPWPPTAALEGPRRPRDRHLCLDVVVQRGAAPLRARRPDARRFRGRLPSQVSARGGMRKPNQRAFVKPRPIPIFLSTNDSTTRGLDHQRISPMTEEAGVQLYAVLESVEVDDCLQCGPCLFLLRDVGSQDYGVGSLTLMGGSSCTCFLVMLK